MVGGSFAVQRVLQSGDIADYVRVNFGRIILQCGSEGILTVFMSFRRKFVSGLRDGDIGGKINAAPAAAGNGFHQELPGVPSGRNSQFPAQLIGKAVHVRDGVSMRGWRKCGGFPGKVGIFPAERIRLQLIQIQLVGGDESGNIGQFTLERIL